ncbi:unnamed protein product [Darwinula stevensoni]|uniref:Uncharacterized protein n=1 Tax=Darwinula stevensoni TaxID=69355 RepID=A0A7R9A5W6_9CRUS|nr:unnamed protein product [Darwinula stevensoni]CAG0895341.1 unnamed protein product [Darwinula stevensoni]
MKMEQGEMNEMGSKKTVTDLQDEKPTDTDSGPQGHTEVYAISKAEELQEQHSFSSHTQQSKRQVLSDIGIMALQQLKRELKHGSTLVDMNIFLDKLAERHIITVVQERDLKAIKKSFELIDETFFILLGKNPQLTYQSVLEILQEMGRGDMIVYLGISKRLIDL